jgi:hypothetical protein
MKPYTIPLPPPYHPLTYEWEQEAAGAAANRLSGGDGSPGQRHNKRYSRRHTALSSHGFAGLVLGRAAAGAAELSVMPLLPYASCSTLLYL